MVRSVRLLIRVVVAALVCNAVDPDVVATVVTELLPILPLPRPRSGSHTRGTKHDRGHVTVGEVGLDRNPVQVVGGRGDVVRPGRRVGVPPVEGKIVEHWAAGLSRVEGTSSAERLRVRLRSSADSYGNTSRKLLEKTGKQ